MKRIIKHVSIVLENGTIMDGNVLIQNGKIVEVGNVEDQEADVLFDGTNQQIILLPGFIDVHIHGANGYDVMDASLEALEGLSSALPREGTTSYLATTMTQEANEIEEAVINVERYMTHQSAKGRAEVLGIHLEGPFISKDKAGAQPIQHILTPNPDLFDKWQRKSGNAIRLVTLAPEVEGGLSFIEHITNQGVVASIGHSDATYEEVTKAVQSGARHVTHLFNQMRGLHHREPGVIGATFLNPKLIAEMIVDGVHVHPEAVRLAYANKGPDKTILITDAMRAKCLPEGTYTLGGQQVNVEGKEARLSDGTLAGSIVTLQQAAKNMRQITSLEWDELVKLTSVNAAKQIGVYDRKGSITPGKDADIVLVDKELQIEMTICKGIISFEKGKL
ncbi:N-acetylglucosamine-6-phosphate deacetylase [Pontibacillus litoralis]|uniref:N-acetylglucosamine-6-phosphate deacetylase n=1 Tax=Pontibacillus litoralis JSM 072002 TaxID=1385512 RepID=A0A0A5HX20_9BACI|nr:N-acetylglucosamine-6-phosphate deacetylase [Pontibacillus litoralis]KGX88182.1 N-acetylglucosamine-6-phosphate deacetylase [Pontibacillus litoralis JSM 072002]